MRPFRHPTAPKRQAPMGRGCRPTVNFYAVFFDLRPRIDGVEA